MTDAVLPLPRAAVGRILVGKAASAAIFLAVLLSGFVLFEPAPYELLVAGMIGLWTITGALTVPRSVMFLLVTVLAFNIGGAISTMQMLTWEKAPLYVAISTFLGLSAVFFASLIARKPERLELIFKAWTIAAVATSLAAIGGYFAIVPGAGAFVLYDRAKGFFEDPNVFAPYLALPTLYSVHLLLTRPARHLVSGILVSGILLAGVFLSFSRAGWGLLLASCMALVFAHLAHSRSNRFRLRLTLLTLLAVAGAAALLVVALQFESVRSIFFARAQVLQDYDASHFGRFERQLMGFMLATERPFGIGPMEFGRIYGEDPHNIWLKMLMAYSWLGFAAYATMILVTLGAGFRILFRDRPWQPYLLCAYIVFLGHVAMGAVIDTDHWRHFFLLLGIVWGCIALEAQHGRDTAARISR